MKTVYLAGPMRDYKLFNFPAFFAAAIELRKMGYEVTNPAEYDMAMGMDPSLDVNDPDQVFMDMDIILRQDFRQVLDADIIVFLPGWEASVGARAERVVAHYSGRTIYLYSAPTDTEPARIRLTCYLKPTITFGAKP